MGSWVNTNSSAPLTGELLRWIRQHRLTGEHELRSDETSFHHDLLSLCDRSLDPMSEPTWAAVRRLARLLVEDVIVPVQKRGSKGDQSRNYDYTEDFNLLSMLRGLPRHHPFVRYMDRLCGTAWRGQETLKGACTSNCMAYLSEPLPG